jgi:hypothetical protein
VDDPLRFVAAVLDHLPPRAEGLLSHRSHLIAQVKVALAVRAYATGDIAKAEHHLSDAIAFYPPMLEQGQGFLDTVCHQAINPPVTAPLEYIDTVFRNLPAGAERLGRLRSRALSEVSVGCAFRNYTARRYHLVVQEVFRALQQRPAHLANRGVISILLRSTLGLLTGKYARRGLSSGTATPGS